MQKRTQDSKERQFEELVIDVKSVVKVNKGGRQRRYSATVVIGDRKGKGIRYKDEHVRRKEGKKAA